MANEIVEAILLIQMDKYHYFNVSDTMKIYAFNFIRFGKPFTQIVLTDISSNDEYEVECWDLDYRNKNEIQEIIQHIFSEYVKQ